MDGLAPAFLPEFLKGRSYDLGDQPAPFGTPIFDFDEPGISYGEAPASIEAPSDGILYVEDFDAPEAPPQAAPVPEIAAPHIMPEQLDAAQAEGFAAGHATGLAEARAEQATIHAELAAAALAGIGDALANARADAARVAQHMADELAATMLALLQAAMPAAADSLAAQEIIALVSALLPGLKREPNASIHVHPSLLGDIGGALQSLWPDHGGRLALLPDATLAAADVRVAWEDGEARRDTRALWSGVRASLAPYGLPSLNSILEGVANGQ